MCMWVCVYMWVVGPAKFGDRGHNGETKLVSTVCPDKGGNMYMGNRLLL